MTTTVKTDTRYFIAVPGNDHGAGIYGIGLTHEDAVADAVKGSGCSQPTVGLDDEGEWVVHDYQDGSTEGFRDETEARNYAAERGFIARECTERLYRHIEKDGCDAGSFRWKQSHPAIDDLEICETDLAGALAEVMDGLDGVDDVACAAWEAKSALTDAHEYVDAYIAQDDTSEYYVTVTDREFRTALDLAVRDKLLAEIAERDAA